MSDITYFAAKIAKIIGAALYLTVLFVAVLALWPTWAFQISLVLAAVAFWDE